MTQVRDQGLIPLPMQFQPGPGCLTLGPRARLILASEQVSADQARSILPLNLEQTSGSGIGIRLTSDRAEIALGEEGYRLEIEAHGVTLRALATSGYLHGLQTLRQLVSLGTPEAKSRNHTCSIPCCVIRDRPRYSWRGMHLDVSRHFFSISEIKRFLDLCALHKFNTFHWHMTDDQGWRIEIEKWPRLTSVGAWRGEATDRYGGYYTRAEIRDVVHYATTRGITIVPEIELPGHAQAAIAAYPWLGNTSEHLGVRTDWGPSPHVYSVSERTLAFLEDCLREVIDLFPGTFIHVGGDECNLAEWHVSEQAQERIRQHGLSDEEGLQAWFIGRIGAFFERHGRRLIGWDEIHSSGLPTDACIMSWRGEEHAVRAARAGHDVVMAPTSHCNLDYYQGDRSGEPMAYDGDLLLETVYGFEPTPKSLNATEASRILGAQCTLWTEHIATWDHLMYMAYPRACAMAEALWSMPERRSYRDFVARWQRHARRLSALGVNYRPVDL